MSGSHFQTSITIQGTQFLINGKPTYTGLGSQSAGRLMNVRMVNCVSEDENLDTRPLDFDADKNTDAFIDTMEEYRASGILAFSINLQGGLPGYEGALNSAFRSDGSLKADYMARVARVIEAADAKGMAIVLGFFYQRQDHRLDDEEAVKRGTASSAAWVRGKGYTNVLIEIANEYWHNGFDHSIIYSDRGEVELMGIVKKTAPGLLVSTAGMGNVRFPREIAEVADFILLHGNSTDPVFYEKRVSVLRVYGKPIIFNEDWGFPDDPRRVGDVVEKGIAAFQTGASWGIMNERRNQYWPFVYGIGDPGDGENARLDAAAYKSIRRLLGTTA